MIFKSPIVVAYGGGLNSTAMLVGLRERGERPDLILFADTGGEKPATYEHVELMDSWCKDAGWPGIQTVRNDGMYSSLEENCLAKGMLPSIAYGWKSCSDKYKRRPQDKFVNEWFPAMRCWTFMGRVTKLIGYDADEQRRAVIYEDKKYVYRYPLMEWGWGREDCVEAVRRAGLNIPQKSSCFFCPSMKKWEIVELQKTNPDLFARALAMEDKAGPSLTTVKGLGRNFSWREFSEGRIPLKLADAGGPPEAELPCECYDGTSNEEMEEDAA